MYVVSQGTFCQRSEEVERETQKTDCYFHNEKMPFLLLLTYLTIYPEGLGGSEQVFGVHVNLHFCA